EFLFVLKNLALRTCDHWRILRTSPVGRMAAMRFGELLGRLRREAGLTQAGLADKAGLSARTVQSWEQGRRAPVSPDFFKLVKALGVSADAFAGVAANRPGRPPGTARGGTSQSKAGKGPSGRKKRGTKGRYERTFRARSDEGS